MYLLVSENSQGFGLNNIVLYSTIPYAIKSQFSKWIYPVVDFMENYELMLILHKEYVLRPYVKGMVGYSDEAEYQIGMGKSSPRKSLHRPKH